MSTLTNSATTSGSSITSRSVAFTANTGDLVIYAIGFGPAVISNFGVTGGGLTWQRAVNKVGSNPPNRRIEIWWSVASATGSLTVTGAWTEAATVVAYGAAFAVGGSGDIDVAATGNFEETSSSTSHNSADASGLDMIAEDVALSVGMVESTNGGYTPGTDWTTLHATGTSTGSQYRLPSGAVTDNRGPWTSASSRTAASAMAVWRRVAADPEPEIIFQYPQVRRRGLNCGVN